MRNVVMNGWFPVEIVRHIQLYLLTYLSCAGGSARSAVVVSKRSVRVNWCDERALASTISNVSRASSAANNCPPERNSTCSTKTDSSAKTTILSSSKVSARKFHSFFDCCKFCNGIVMVVVNDDVLRCCQRVFTRFIG